MNDPATVFVVDDDEAVRTTLTRSLRHYQYSVEAFASAEAFLNAIDSGCKGCLVLDIAMPGMSGLELQSELNKQVWTIPVIFITGHADVPISVRAIKTGAMELLEKPYRQEVLLERIEEALSRDAATRTDAQRNAEILDRFELLTPREKEVMSLLVAGAANHSNKEVARQLGLSYRTVDEYRAHIMTKMQAQSITHLAEIATVCGIKRN